MLTSTNQPLPWVQPYMQDLLGRTQEVANQQYTPSPNTAVQANPYLQTGWNAVANRALQGSPVMGAANNLAQQTMQGQFLNNNPYLGQQIADAQGDLVKSWNQVQRPSWETAMQRSGSIGNSGVAEMAGSAQDSLQRNLGRIASDMRGNAYGMERGYMNQAMGMAPGMAQSDYMDAQQLLMAGNQRQAFDQSRADQNYRWWQEAQQFPIQGLDQMRQSLGMGSLGNQQTQPDPSKLSTAVGGALTGSQLASLFGTTPGTGALWGGLLGLLGG